MVQANKTKQPTITRTERGLTVSGTRITLYDVMDYMNAGYPRTRICEKLCLSTAHMEAALHYIEAHRSEVDAEYEAVLKAAEADRQYWERRNRDRLADIASAPIEPGQEAIRSKLQVWKDSAIAMPYD
ncbi:MAG: DUF433 domain-containing protein [Cyanobacteria bacterium J06555_13]